MKTASRSICIVTLFVLLSIFNPQLSAAPLGTAFIYQGQLADGSNPATGTYDLRFAIYDAGTSGNLIAGPLTNSAVGVTNGLFTVMLDFGPGVFTGASLWLQMGVRTNGAAAFTSLAPLQPVRPAPYAIFANTASNLSGTIPASQLSGMVANGQLAHSSVLINAGTGLSGGGSVVLGTSTTLNNTGVLSVNGGGGVSASTLNGVVTLSSAAGGDLSGSVANCTVSGINGSAVGNSVATAGNLLVGSGVQWVSTPLSGDAALSSGGVLHIGGLTTNIAVLAPGGQTNTLCFTNGVLRTVQ